MYKTLFLTKRDKISVVKVKPIPGGIGTPYILRRIPWR
jgi:hypothetical protein